MNRTVEDLLRDALHGRDEPVGPGSFEDVRGRAGRLARRSRRIKASVAALAVLTGIGVSVPLLTRDDTRPQPVVTKPGPDKEEPLPSTVPPSTVPPSTVPPSTVPPSTVPPVSDEPLGIWPFTTGGEADDESIDLPFDETDPAVTGRAFLETVAAMHPAGAEPPRLYDSGRAADVEYVGVVPTEHTIVTLRRLGASDRWTVVAARADGLILESPTPNAEVAGFVADVAGKATAFEGTVLVRVIDRAKTPNELGKAVLTGEMGVLKPFSGEVPFRPGELSVGAVIAVTESAKDGSVEQVAAVPVRFGAVS